MQGQRTPEEMLEHLRKEAKRRLKAFRGGKTEAVRWYREMLPHGPEQPTLRDIQLAVARTFDFPGWAELKRAFLTPLPEDNSRDGILNRFLDNACPDHHVRGRQDHRRAEATAMRLLEQNPWLARHDFNTAVVCGEIESVRDAIARDSRVAVVASSPPSAIRGMSGGANDLYRQLGPKGWTPLLYLCFTRLPLAASQDNAVAIARLLLDAGADPNAFFHAGDSHYTPMTGLAGEGEEDRPPHAHRDEITRLLLQHDANPYDIQVLYDLGFRCEYMWWLPMIHAHCVRTGRAGDWKDPEWTMLDMGGYGCGARWFLQHAIHHRKPDLAAWCLAHGASPNPPPPAAYFSRNSLYVDAVRTGQPEIAELLVRHGAPRVPVEPKPVELLVEAAKANDRHRVASILDPHPELLSDPFPMFVAADLNRPDMIHLLIDAGYSPNVADEKNTRPLNRAAGRNSLAAAQALVERGAEIDSVENNYGGTALGNATHFLHREVSDFLAARSKDVWNLTYNGYLDRLREVIEAEPERARVDWDVWSPLLWLPPNDEDVAIEMARLFVKHGADKRRRASNGDTPRSRAEALGMMRLAAYFRQ
jgi:uncharacterized protein